jgi:hypothetical protein
VPQAALHLEILALRHQLQVLQRSRRRRIRLTQADRLLWVWLSTVWTQWRSAVVIVKPETVIAWHRAFPTLLGLVRACTVHKLGFDLRRALVFTEQTAETITAFHNDGLRASPGLNRRPPIGWREI